MTENMKKFLERVSQDEDLANKLSGADKAALIEAEKALGLALTNDDFEQPSDLSDDELEAVAGGDCYCAIGGEGKSLNEYYFTDTKSSLLL